MKKKELIKKILELGKELEAANGFDAVMIVNDMELEVEKYTKQLHIHNVVNQRELFMDLVTFTIDMADTLTSDEILDKWIEGNK